MLAGTRLCVGLTLARDPLDLNGLTKIVSQDPVAVLTLFRLIGEGDYFRWDAPRRLEECVASLGREEFQAAFMRQARNSTSEQGAYMAFTQEALQVASVCRRLAQVLGMEEESAFLLGLLHKIGGLPVALGRVPAGPVHPESPGKVAERIACLYHVPLPLSEALIEIHGGHPRSIWVALVRAAHDFAATDDASTSV